MKSKILIVGGTGFIGYHAAKYAIKKGWKVTSISLKKAKKYRLIPNVNYIQVNISNLNSLRKKIKGEFDYVLNVGGYVNHSSKKKDRKKIFNEHYLGLVNLTKIFLQKNIKSFVQIGTSAEYGKITKPHHEKIICKPNSFYSQAKLQATQHLLRLFKKKRFPATILRFYLVYGPKQDNNRFVSNIIIGCIKNKKFPCSKGDQMRDFCYIDDVIKSIFLSFRFKEAKGNIFNIGYGKPIKIKKLIKYINLKVGKGFPQFGLKKYRDDEVLKYYPIIKKVKNKLKWKPKISLKNGINKTIKFYNENKFNI